MARVTIIAMLIGCLLGACSELDPVNVQSLCEGAGPIPEECPQCQSRPFEASCPQCQMSGVDAETCLPPGVPKASLPDGVSGEGSPDGGGTSPTGDNQVPGTGPDAQPGGSDDGAAGSSANGDGGNRGGENDGSGGQGGEGGLPPGVEPMAGSSAQTPRGCQFEGCNTPGFPACRPDGVCSECLMDDHCPDGQCDVPANRCVECMNDIGCEAKGQVCYKDARVCVQCNDDGHCAAKTPETPACNANHECVACLQDIHCPSATPACDQMTCYECRMDNQCNGPGKHACIEAEHTCVECKNNMHCASEAGRPLCNAEANECVQCLSDSDCKDRGASNCDSETHTCVPCSDSAQCAQFAGTAPRCAAGNCVACDADGGICNGKACILTSNICSTKNRQSVAACGECESSDECVPGHVCVEVRYGSVVTGNFCLPNLADFRACPRPFGRKQRNVLTLEDFRIDTLCTLAETTTCEALKDTIARKQCGANNNNCGLGSSVLGNFDGYCAVDGCTYNCETDEFCPNDMSCSESMKICN